MNGAAGGSGGDGVVPGGGSCAGVRWAGRAGVHGEGDPGSGIPGGAVEIEAPGSEYLALTNGDRCGCGAHDQVVEQLQIVAARVACPDHVADADAAAVDADIDAAEDPRVAGERTEAGELVLIVVDPLPGGAAVQRPVRPVVRILHGRGVGVVGDHAHRIEGWNRVVSNAQTLAHLLESAGGAGVDLRRSPCAGGGVVGDVDHTGRGVGACQPDAARVVDVDLDLGAARDADAADRLRVERLAAILADVHRRAGEPVEHVRVVLVRVDIDIAAGHQRVGRAVERAGRPGRAVAVLRDLTDLAHSHRAGGVGAHHRAVGALGDIDRKSV